jgi:catechol 2,3-dioxygenase-like lactoylglutathione lyase family enzyme
VLEGKLGSYGIGNRVQLAFVVRDMEEALNYWVEKLGVKRFVLFQTNAGARRLVYNGHDTQMDMALAFTYLGDTQIELVSPINDEPSPYKDFLDAGRSGLHHIAFWPSEFASECQRLEREGFEEICAFYTPQGEKNVAYYKAPAAVGTIVELVPLTEDRKRYFAKIRELVESDEIADTVLRYASRQEFLNVHGS